MVKDNLDSEIKWWADHHKKAQDKWADERRGFETQIFNLGKKIENELHQIWDGGKWVMKEALSE